MSLRDRVLGLSVIHKGLLLLAAGALLFGIDYIEPARHRQFIMRSIPLWSLGIFALALGVITVVVGLVRRR
jgi:dipeptide/tripeptide permease